MGETFDLAGRTTRYDYVKNLRWTHSRAACVPRKTSNSRRVYTPGSNLKLFFSASNERAEQWHFACKGSANTAVP